VFELFYSANPTPRTIYNRKHLFLETAIDKTGEAAELFGEKGRIKIEDCVPFGGSKIMERSTLSDGLFPLMVSWEGSEEFRNGLDQDFCLYYTPSSMDLGGKSMENSRDFTMYLERIEDMRNDLENDEDNYYDDEMMAQSQINLNEEPVPTKRSWVKLEDIMWTLEPEELFSVIFSDYDMTFGEFKTEVLGIGTSAAGEEGNDGGGEKDGLSSPRLVQRQDSEKIRKTTDFDIMQSDVMQSGTSKFHEAKKAQRTAKRKFEAVKCLAEAYVAQITLFANLCYGRNYQCISPIARQFSFAMCLTGIGHPRYPSQLKAAFSRLMMNIWIDRLPHRPLLLPNSIRLKDHVHEVKTTDEIMIPVYELSIDDPVMKSPAAKFNDFYLCMDHNKFWLLEQVIIANLNDTQGLFIRENQYRNELTLVLLKTLTLLTNFGFVRSIPKIQKLANKILLSLDGRDDIGTNAEHDKMVKQNNAKQGGGVVKNLADIFSFNPLQNVLDLGVNLVEDDTVDDGPVDEGDARGYFTRIRDTLLVSILGEEPFDDDEVFFSTVPQFPATIVKSLPKDYTSILKEYGLLAIQANKTVSDEVVHLNKAAADSKKRYKKSAEASTILQSKNELLNIVFQFEMSVIDVMISQVMWELEQGMHLFQEVVVTDLNDAVLSGFWLEKYAGAGKQIFLTDYGLQVFRSLIRGSRAKTNRLVSLTASSTVPVITTFLDLLMYEDGESCEGGLKGLNWQFRFVMGCGMVWRGVGVAWRGMRACLPARMCHVCACLYTTIVVYAVLP
jgi:hypothetical protein